ncbi:unnamed protein product [Thelazia callipaeda]|uniref:Ribosome biogenesis protein NSA2 homolog n=1 Tax=Thelazia callipaeda TaxID=103827 RepID=A0A0N5D3B6_THECL|nr:unnamed protein product [Thelazia callipaeda]
MNEGGGKRSDDEGDDLLWNDFENCAQSVTILYRTPSWKAMQTAAAYTTQLYKSSIEHKKKAYDRGVISSYSVLITGYVAGKQTLAREIYALRRYNTVSIDDVWKLLSKIVCAAEYGYCSRSSTPEQTDSPAVSLFQQALCIPSNVASPQRATELNSFLSLQPQNEHIELHRKRCGRRFDHEERVRKRIARGGHERSQYAKKVRGRKAKLYHKKRYAEKVEMRRLLRQHEEKQQTNTIHDPNEDREPQYLIDREEQVTGSVLSSMVKQKRKEKAGKYQVPLPKIKAVSDSEAFKVVTTGKTRRKGWKRMVTKVTFVGESFTRKPAKFERFIRPMGLRFKKAHVTHPELQATFHLPIVGVKKNPSSSLYTSLGVITKGTIIEVNISELGLVTQGGKVVWAKYAQVTNNPENDGCINAVLLL